jgi:hypothetical protein
VTFAHAGHWAVNLLFVAPLVVVVGAILRDRRRMKREERLDGDPDLGSRN